jgi:hypothetical protein
VAEIIEFAETQPGSEAGNAGVGSRRIRLIYSPPVRAVTSKPCSDEISLLRTIITAKIASFAGLSYLWPLIPSLEGCAVVAVADTAVTVVATTVKVGAKVVGAAVDLVIPGDDQKEKKWRANGTALREVFGLLPPSSMPTATMK